MASKNIIEINPEKYRDLKQSHGCEAAVEQLFKDMGFMTVSWRDFRGTEEYYDFSRKKPKRDSVKTAVIEVCQHVRAMPHTIIVYARDVEIGYIHPKSHRIKRYTIGYGKHERPISITGSGLDFEKALSSLLDAAFAPEKLIREYSLLSRQIEPSDGVLIVSEGTNHRSRKIFLSRSTIGSNSPRI
jgi:hypothetical protein